MGADELDDLLLWGQVRFHELLLALDELADGLFRHQVEQLLLALDMVVETPLEHAHFVGDILDRGRMVALLFEQLGCSRDDLLRARRAHALILWPIAVPWLAAGRPYKREASGPMTAVPSPASPDQTFGKNARNTSV